MLRYIVSLLAVAEVALAVDGSTGPENSTISTEVVGEITVHKVTVGRAKNSFQPNSILAKAGDIVSFEFYPTNHSVIRATYGYPCVPYEAIVEDGRGFTSGPMPVNSSGALPTWNITINNTEPIFFYCGAPGSCFGWGMLGVINANNATDLSKQIAIARQETYEIWPGESLSAPALASLAAIAATATLVSSTHSSPSSTSTTIVAATSSAAIVKESGTNGISGGAIAGIVIGSVAVLVIAAGVFFFIGQIYRRRRNVNAHGLPHQTVPMMSGGGARYSGFPGPYSSQHLPPYVVAANKGQYAEHGVYHGGESTQTPPMPYSDRHHSYQDQRSVNSTPPPRLSERQSMTSELDGGAMAMQHAVHDLDAIPELDARNHRLSSRM